MECIHLPLFRLARRGSPRRVPVAANTAGLSLHSARTRPNRGRDCSMRGDTLSPSFSSKPNRTVGLLSYPTKYETTFDLSELLTWSTSGKCRVLFVLFSLLASKKSSDTRKYHLVIQRNPLLF